MTESPETPPTILLIEDDASIRHMMHQVLRTAGYRVLVASNEAEAAAHWDREGASVDLLLADIFLESSTGAELARGFRASRPDLKVMVISGSDDPVISDLVELANAGVFLAKPFKHVALLQAVSDALG